MSVLLFSAFEAADAPLVAPPPLPFATAFSAAILAADRAAQSLLGGQPVTYAPEVGSPVSITGIFDSVFVLVRGGDVPAGVEALGPAVFLRLEDIPSDPELDDPTLTINGTDYVVIERVPDGIGGIVLALRTAS